MLNLKKRNELENEKKPCFLYHFFLPYWDCDRSLYILILIITITLHIIIMIISTFVSVFIIL